MSTFCTAKATHIFVSKKFQNICVSLDVNVNELLTNDIISFEQLGPGEYEAKLISKAGQKRAQRKVRAKASQRNFLPQTSLVLSATSSLEISVVSSAIFEHTKSSAPRIGHCQ